MLIITLVISVVHSISAWSGRPCCDLAVNRFCEQSCRQVRVTSRGDRVVTVVSPGKSYLPRVVTFPSTDSVSSRVAR